MPLLTAIFWLLEEEHERKMMNFSKMKAPPRLKHPSKRRPRARISTATCYLSSTEFRQAFRMFRHSFLLLLCQLKSSLSKNEQQAKPSIVGAIFPQVRLAVRFTTKCCAGRLGNGLIFKYFTKLCLL